MAKTELPVTTFEKQLQVVPVTGFPSHQQLSFLWVFYSQRLERLVPGELFVTLVFDARTVLKKYCKMSNIWYSQ
jgi:hypothetical protein